MERTAVPANNKTAMIAITQPIMWAPRNLSFLSGITANILVRGGEKSLILNKSDSAVQHQKICRHNHKCCNYCDYHFEPPLVTLLYFRHADYSRLTNPLQYSSSLGVLFAFTISIIGQGFLLWGLFSALRVSQHFLSYPRKLFQYLRGFRNSPSIST